MIWLSIQGPATIITTIVARIFGMKVSVISWICVIAWKMLTSRPTIRPAPRMGSATFRESVTACMTRLMTTSVFIPASVEALDEGLGDEVPAVDQDEQQDLER